MLRNTLLAAVFTVILSPAIMLAGKKQPLSSGLQQAGTVSSVVRNARVLRPAMPDPEADYGTGVAWGDTLRTDGNGRIRLQLDNDSVLSIGADSELVFAERKGRTTSLHLNHGRMRVMAAKDEAFEIRTDTALITGSASDFAIDASIHGRLRVICLGGTVQVTNAGASSECDAGEFVIVKNQSAPRQPQLADATTLGIWRNITDPEEQAPVQYFP